MKHFLPLFLLAFFAFTTNLNAQLPDGSIAPDWTHDDIFGNSHHLYDLLDDGKMVVIEFSATWCGPCWNYMMTGALEEFWNEHGPNGADDAQVFYIEADQATGIDDLYGLTPESQGNWVEAIPFPIIDLQVGENTDLEYQITYYPTLFAVCADKKLYELGQVPASEWEEFITSCTLEATVGNIEAAVCYGDGEVELDVTGGINPISYDWSDGSDDPVLQGVGAGVYSVTVTEGNGKDVVIEDIVITGADEPIGLADSEIEPALCFESSTGSVSIELEDAVEPISYDWSNGANTQNIYNVPADTYEVVATDDNGCTFEASFIVTEPEELTAEYETTPDYCDQSNGTVELTIEGGVGNYDISSSEGTVVGNMIIDVPGGIVVATVEDGNGCIWVQNIAIESVAEPTLYFTPSPLITCLEPTTTVTGYVEDGSGDYEYEWTTTNGHIVGPTNQPSIVVDQPGDYNLLVYDLFSACQAENEVEVNSTITPPPVAAGADLPISCENLEPILAGVGNPEYTITWTTVDGHIVSGEHTYTPTVDAPGTYVIEVVNPANQCTNTDAVVVLNELNPASAAFQYQTSGLSMIGTDISTGSGLSNWQWTFGDGNSSSEQNAVHVYATAGTYNVCLSVQNGCGTSETCQAVEVTFTGSVIVVDATIQNVLCFGDSTGSIVLVVNGGSGNYTYTWTGPNGSSYSTPAIDSIIAGLYQLVVSDDAGNIFIGEYTIVEPPALALAGSTVVDNLCFGQSNGSISVDITGGVGPYSYSFGGGPSQSENYATNLPGGTIECLITDANGCVFLAGPYNIQEPPALVHQADVHNVRCFGESNGSINLLVSGGVAPYTYLWNVGGSTTQEVTQLPAGIYTCLVTDSNGCLNEVSTSVAQPDSLQVYNLQVVNASSAQHNDGSISLEIAGGIAPYQILWSNGDTTTSIHGLFPGEYTYSITDANGCTLATSAPIIVHGTTSAMDIDWNEFITIAPNPSKGNVLINWEGLEVEKGNVILLTLEGRRITSTEMRSGKGTWDLAHLSLSSGVYVVLFEMNGQSVPFKLVIL